MFVVFLLKIFLIILFSEARSTSTPREINVAKGDGRVPPSPCRILYTVNHSYFLPLRPLGYDTAYLLHTGREDERKKMRACFGIPSLRVCATCETLSHFFHLNLSAANTATLLYFRYLGNYFLLPPPGKLLLRDGEMDKKADTRESLLNIPLLWYEHTGILKKSLFNCSHTIPKFKTVSD